ncbi:hypothetical protein AMTR_s00121p00024600 [Amborella trichopoda]|uniref:Uncharacterized protein n=1 Tax=Amborella trichopoda TaxID=13333 RepID=W1NRR3_AMBTC|nr:hypothetical protein AMTR_s00121p00024600 [Amborella trichopoda]
MLIGVEAEGHISCASLAASGTPVPGGSRASWWMTSNPSIPFSTLLVPPGFEVFTSSARAGEPLSKHFVAYSVSLALMGGDPMHDVLPSTSSGRVTLAPSTSEAGRLTMRHIVRAAFQGMRE